MSNERERLARQWAVDFQGAGKLPAYGIAAQAAAEHIMATTPELTMADEVWDEGDHYLAGCMTQYGEMVMLRPHGVNLLVHDLNSGLTEIWDRDDATPNGKRYELVEVTNQPEHPETLTTEKDYENAPVGTIVALNGFFPYVKQGRDVWADTFDDKWPDDFLSGISRQVLRWGWGE